MAKLAIRVGGTLVAVAALILAGLPGPASASPVADDSGDPGASIEIVGGGPASETYPFMGALLRSGDQFSCGATLIHPRFLVTAAHCYVPFHPDSVRIGSSTWNAGGELADVEQAILAPDDADIALVWLSDDVSAEPAEIAPDAGAPGTSTRLLGWGQTCPIFGCGSVPDDLQELDVTVQASGCVADFDPDTEFCLGGVPDAGPCNGDSGGPALREVDGEWQLTGATSRPGVQGVDCAEEPTIYADVPAWESWIDETIANEGDPCYMGDWRQNKWAYPAGSIVVNHGFAWVAASDLAWLGEPGGNDPLEAWEQLVAC